jgi:hypothetical protein
MADKTKATMILEQKSMDDIKELCDYFQEKNRTRIVRSSLSIVNTLMKELAKGKRIILESKDGRQEELKFIV